MKSYVYKSSGNETGLKQLEKNHSPRQRGIAALREMEGACDENRPNATSLSPSEGRIVVRAVLLR